QRIQGDWGRFTSPDGEAAFALSHINQPAQLNSLLRDTGTVYCGGAVQWRTLPPGTVGPDKLKATMGEAPCNFNGLAGGLISYAAVEAGTVNLQQLLIRVWSARAQQPTKDAALGPVESFRRSRAP